jgi:hypothetical protein
METFIQSFVIPIIAAVGGITAVILVVVKFFGKKIADYISDRAIEKYKSELSVKGHISQYRFDKEIESVGTILGLLYEVTLKTDFLYRNLHHINDDEYLKIYDDCEGKISEFAAAYFKSSLYINKDLSDKFFKIVKLLHEFMQNVDTARYNINQLEEMIGTKFNELGQREHDSCQELYEKAESRVKAIVEEITHDKDHGYNSLVDQAKKYFAGLSVM